MTATNNDGKRSASEVTVVTVVSGRAGHLERLAQGVARSRPVPAELVVVGMGENPEPIDAGEVPVRCERIERPPEGLPLAAARNRAIAAADTEIVLLLDVDCIPSAGLCAETQAVISGHDVIGMAPVGYLPEGMPRDSAWTEEELAASAAFHPDRPRAPQTLAPCEHRLLWSLAMAGRRTSLDARIGGFDPEYVGYGAEDTDFGLRAERAGVPLVWLGAAPAFHQHHHSSSPPVDHVSSIVRNARLFRSKWGWWPMDGWLAEFSALGIVEWDPEGETLRVIDEEG